MSVSTRRSVSWLTVRSSWRFRKGRRYEDGSGPVLDTGAFVAALEYGAHTQAYVVGKPSTELLRMAIEDVGCDPYSAVVVGDSLAADITGAHAVGARSVLVRTGAFSLSALERSERKPVPRHRLDRRAA